MNWIKKNKLSVFLMVVISALTIFILKDGQEINSKQRNTSTTNIINNCDTIYQYINLNPLQGGFYNTAKNPYSQKKKYGVGFNVGYLYNLHYKNSMGLNYGLNFRYQNMMIGGEYFPESSSIGIRLGYMFDFTVDDDILPH